MVGPDAPGNSRPAETAGGMYTPLNTHTQNIRGRERILQQAQVCVYKYMYACVRTCTRGGVGTCSRFRCVCTCGGFLQQAQVSLSQATAVLRGQLVDLGTDSLHRVFGDGSDVRSTLLPQMLQTVLHRHAHGNETNIHPCRLRPSSNQASLTTTHRPPHLSCTFSLCNSLTRTTQTVPPSSPQHVHCHQLVH